MSTDKSGAGSQEKAGALHRGIAPAWRLVRAVVINPGCKITPLTSLSQLEPEILALERSSSLCGPIDSEDLRSFCPLTNCQARFAAQSIVPLTASTSCPHHLVLTEGEVQKYEESDSGVAYITKK